MPSDENYTLQRVLNATTPVELNAAAVSLSRMRDAANNDVALCLRKGEKVYKAYIKDGKTKRYVCIYYHLSLAQYIVPFRVCVDHYLYLLVGI
jgi:hypothetical protein